MEKIAAAALKVGNEVYTAPTHFMAMHKIIRLEGVDKATIADMILQAEDGFVTDTGRFVNRAEAFQIASQAQQITHTELADPEKNKAFYNTLEPSLDSGIIESYAPLRRRYSFIY